jgi:CRISPR-associated protein Csx16
MTTYFITRHLGALEWAKLNEVHFDIHLTHLADLSMFNSGDIVIGILPMHMVAELNLKGVRYVHLSLNIPVYLRGQELTAFELLKCEAKLEVYEVVRQPFS